MECTLAIAVQHFPRSASLLKQLAAIVHEGGPLSVPSTSVPSTSFLSGLRALVVDDDPMMVDIISTLLGDAGLGSIETACNGTAALERLAAHPVELLVCDLNMPEMDG